MDEYEIEDLAKDMATKQDKFWDELSLDEQEAYKTLARVASSWMEDNGYTDDEYFSCGC